MKCSKCGRKNPKDSVFCEHCGERLPGAVYGAGAGQSSQQQAEKKKIIAICSASAALLLICIFAILFVFTGKPGTEYTGRITAADKYLKQKNYSKAEDACLAAIDMEPEQETAYVMLADVYICSGNVNKAEKILEQGSSSAKKQTEINTKKEYVKTYSIYDTYVQKKIVQDIGLAPVGKSYKGGSSSDGLIGSSKTDIDGDGVPEMIDAAYDNDVDGNARLTVSYYTRDGEDVTLKDDVKVDLGQSSNCARKCSAFLKCHEDKYYLVVSVQILNTEVSTNTLYIYDISEGTFDEKYELTRTTDIGYETYFVNGEKVSSYDSYDENGEFQPQEDAEAKLEQVRADGLDEFRTIMEKYGISGKLNQMDSYVDRMFEGADEDDDTENGLCFIQYGVYNKDSVDLINGDYIYVEDLTELHDSMNSRSGEKDSEKAFNGYKEFLAQDTVSRTVSTQEQSWKLVNCDFCTAYIDDDDIPELLLYNFPDTDHVSGYGQLYTFRDGKVCKVTDLNLNDVRGTGYYAKTGWFMDHYAAQGDCDVNVEFFNGKTVNDSYIGEDFKSDDDGNRKDVSYSTYNINGKGLKTIDKKEYESILKEKTGGVEMTRYEFHKNTAENREKHLK